jgi:hypothetical protein
MLPIQEMCTQHNIIAKDEKYLSAAFRITKCIVDSNNYFISIMNT